MFTKSASEKLAESPTTQSLDSYLISFFAALCLFLSAVEYAIPKPLPFLRLGLANLPILLAIKKMPGKNVLLLVVFKILGQALLSGTLFSYIFLFSAAGSLASGIIMLLVYKATCLFEKKMSGKKLISNIGLSLAGALANNGAQLLCARFIMFGENTRYIAPILIITGTITGLCLGIFAYLFEEKSKWFKNLYTVEREQPVIKNSNSERKIEYSNVIWFVLSMANMLCFLFIKDVRLLWLAVLIFFIFTEIRRKGKVKILPSILIVITVTFFALLSPYGKVLFTIGSWRITKDALISGLHRSGILVGMVFLSQCAITSKMQLHGWAGNFLKETFFVFEKLGEKRISFKPGKIIISIDGRLCEIYGKA